MRNTDWIRPSGGAVPTDSPRVVLAMGGRATKPRVRAVVLNYNGANDTLACVASLLRQDYTPLDVVVVDNASSSSDFAVLQSGLPQRVLLLRSERNLGYAGGMNVGARVAGLPRPEFMWFLNNDLLLLDPTTTSVLVNTAEGDARRVAVSPLVAAAGVDLPVERQIQVRRVPGFWSLLIGGSWWLRRLPGLRRVADLFVYADQRPYRPGTVYECESINGSCFLVRAPFLEEIGYLDEGTFLYQEELVLGWQMLARDRVAALTTAVRVIHALGRATGHGGKRVRFSMLMQIVRSDVHYCWRYLRCGPAKLMLLLLVRGLDIVTKMAAQPVTRALRAFGRGGHVPRQ